MHRKTILYYLLILVGGELLISAFLLVVSSEYNLAQVEPMLYYVNKYDIHYDKESIEKWRYSFGGAFAMSPDGSHIITLLPKTQDNPYNYMYFLPSPDGNKVIVSSDFDIYVIELSTQRLIRLTNYGNSGSSLQLEAIHPYWSPAGEWIAYEVGDVNGSVTVPDSGVWVVKADGTKHYQVLNTGTVWGWSSDGKLKIWYTNDNKNGIFLVSLDGKYSEWYSEWDTDISWSPDHRFFIETQSFNGKAFLFSNDNANQVIDILPLDLKPNEINVQRPEWSPNSQWFALQVGVNNNKLSYCYLFSVDGKRKINLNDEIGISPTKNISLVGLGWSSDGSLFALHAKTCYKSQKDEECFDWISEGIYVYSPETHSFVAVPMPTESSLLAEIGWWPQPKTGKFGIPIQIIRYGIIYRNLLIITIGISGFLVSIIALFLSRQYSHDKENPQK